MVARAAADDVDAVDRLDVVIVQVELVEKHAAVLDGAGDGVAHGARLLEDLFQHEIRVAAALGALGIPIDVRERGLDRGGFPS